MLKEILCGNSKAVIDTKGAELKSLIIDDREIMWCADPAFWGKSSPILFPAIGNVKNNKTVINGETISLTKHGFARDSEFSLYKSMNNSAIFTKTFFLRKQVSPLPASFPLHTLYYVTDC